MSNVYFDTRPTIVVATVSNLFPVNPSKIPLYHDLIIFHFSEKSWNVPFPFILDTVGLDIQCKFHSSPDYN